MIKNVKMVVIEQDSMIRNVMVDVLEFSVNREVLSFDNGMDALDHMENNERVDIVICAADIPGISGIDLLSTIKTKWPHITCISVTDQFHDHKRMDHPFIDSYLTKPFDTKDLFNIVQRYVVEGQSS